MLLAEQLLCGTLEVVICSGYLGVLGALAPGHEGKTESLSQAVNTRRLAS